MRDASATDYAKVRRPRVGSALSPFLHVRLPASELSQSLVKPKLGGRWGGCSTSPESSIDGHGPMLSKSETQPFYPAAIVMHASSI